MAGNELSLYRRIGSKLKLMAGIKVASPILSYDDSEEGNVEMQVGDFEGPVVEITDGNWSPTENNLIYEQKFVIEHPNELFGEEKITDSANKIGLAAHIYSKTSLLQETIAVPVDIVDDTDVVQIDFRHVFDPGWLRGYVCIDFFLYLKELNKKRELQADRIGMNLCQDDLYKARIVIDGDGVMFPITEYYDPDGPLWTIEKDWRDPSTDEFDITNVRIKLNTANSLAKKVTKSTGAMANEITSMIMLQSVAMIIYETVLDMKRYYDGLNKADAVEGSILEVVKGWIMEYDVDTTNIMTIVDSLQNGELHEKMQLRGKNND